MLLIFRGPSSGGAETVDFVQYQADFLLLITFSTDVKLTAKVERIFITARI